MKKIEQMNKDELTNILYDKELDLEELLILSNEMKKYEFSDFDYDTLKAYIDDELDKLLYNKCNIKQLKEYVSNLKNKYKGQLINFTYLDNRIKEKEIEMNNIEKIEKKEKTISSFDVFSLFKTNTTSKQQENAYEDYQYEEQELEDDDYYKEDID